MFTQAASSVGDDLAYSSVMLGQRLRALGHGVATLDMQPLTWFDRIMFLDYPTKLNSYLRQLLRIQHPDVNLMASEPPMIRLANYTPETHALFRRVWTWKKDLVAQDPKKCVLFHIPNKFTEPPEPMAFGGRKLCVMINRFMALQDARELFSERIRAIRWFEGNAPNDFDLFGSEWDKPLFMGRWSAVNLPLRLMYRRIGAFKGLKVRRFPSFRGPVPSKNATLRQYRFCVAYENCVEPDYLSEKLFDCFFAGCVPIYLGAPNVLDTVPADAFIDRRKFANYGELHRYISTLSEREYNRYLDAARDFLHSPAMRPYTAEGFADNFIANFAS